MEYLNFSKLAENDFDEIIYDAGGIRYTDKFEVKDSELNCDYILDNGLDISNLTLNFHTANVVGKENMMCYWNNFKESYEEGL